MFVHSEIADRQKEPWQQRQRVLTQFWDVCRRGLLSFHVLSFCFGSKLQPNIVSTSSDAHILVVAIIFTVVIKELIHFRETEQRWCQRIGELGKTWKWAGWSSNVNFEHWTISQKYGLSILSRTRSVWHWALTIWQNWLIIFTYFLVFPSMFLLGQTTHISFLLGWK